MNLRRFLLLASCACALVLSVHFVLAPLVAHAQVDTGFQTVGQQAGLGTADPRVIAARIINIALGFVGIILVCIMVYAGFLWMTAGGNPEQVEKAQHYIRNAIIGVIIIVSAWAITTFVINKLLGAVGGGGGGVTSSGSVGGGGDFGTGGAALGFQVRSISPSGSVPLRNVEVRFLFTRDVSAGSATSSIKVLRASDSQPVDGVLRIEGNLVTFTPRTPCPSPAGDRFCFAGDTEFIARVERSLRSNLGQSLACGSFAPACEVHFRTGNMVDIAAPRIFLTAPINGQGLPQNDAIRVRSHAEDDSGISVIESFVNGRSIGLDAPMATSTGFSFDSNTLWDTRGLATGTYRIESRALDIDSNRSTSSPISVALRPRHCFNGTRDDDETGLDCGGSSCGACSGSACTVPTDCSAGVCASGRCVDQPIITSVTPADGRVGTFVTITGFNFGTTTGQVMFGGRPASAPAACLSVSSSTLWNPTQAIVAVPEGATTSSISLMNRNSSLSDATNDDRGPRIADFRVNNVAHPGLCGATPDRATLGGRTRINFSGTGLGTTPDHVLFNDRSFDSFLEWRDTGIGMNAPLIAAGGYSVNARVGSIDSNSVNFAMYDPVITAAPVIDLIEPAGAAAGDMITLTGRNFGDRGQVFFRNPTTGAAGLADTTFPELCRNDYWRNNTIIVKVPRTLRDGLGAERALGAGGVEVYVRRDGTTDSNHYSFNITAGPPGPGLCAIVPIAGPANTRVSLIGERFGTVPGAVAFPGSASGTSVAATVSSEGWIDGQIQTRVPSGSASGLVRVTANGIQSNGTYFRVANCHDDVAMCGVGSSCCADGSCSVSGVCPTSATSSQFAWVASTGRIILNPAVVDECNNENPPSPSPRGNAICVNAQVVVRFTTHINPTTINDRNVLIQRCTGLVSSASSDPCASGTPETIPGRFEFRVGATQDHLIFTPTGTTLTGPFLWSASSTYRVILRTGIRSTSSSGDLPMLENALRYGTGNAYAFRFTTRNTSELCRAGSVSVDPFRWTMDQLGETKEYGLSPRAEGDICVQLNGDTMGWAWSVSDRGRASLSDVDPARSSRRIVTGLGATLVDPVLVNAELTLPVPPAPVRGSGRLYINIAPPHVEDYAPNCDQACVNAAIWARFNVPMETTTLYHSEGGLFVPNIIVKQCVNESCREFDRTLDLSESTLDMEDAPGYAATNTLLKLEPTRIVRDRTGAPVLDADGNPRRETQLLPERFYRVWILGGESGLRSQYGRLFLTGLNDTDPVAFSWKFRVRGGSSPRCSVDHITVAPGQKYESVIGARQFFGANPISAPDVCRREGQMLISEGPFHWTTSEAAVADFVRTTLGVGGRSSVALATRLPPGCTDQCTNAGSQSVIGQTAQCGNRTVETADPNYCHRRSDATQRCLLNNPDCVTRFGDNCLVLNPGTPVAEECDNGSSNGASGECSTSCLWNPAHRVTDTVPGSCGNGTIERGEQCDPGRICTSGSATGTDCTRSASVCGAGGVCGVAPRHGCSDQCQALGARSAGSTCGNNDVADGETCDNQLGPGLGCTRDCLHLGSSSVEQTVCGNARLEAGESCETSVSGSMTGQYCHLNLSGVLTCTPGTDFHNLCDQTTCLNRGTNACTSRTSPNCCGNATVDPGEDCDGGEGCSARCLATGSSPAYRTPSICGDRVRGTGEQCDAPTTAAVVVSNRQLFEITGLREPTSEELRLADGRMASTLGAEYDSHRGEAIYGVQCNFSSESSCTTRGTGLTTGGCCAARPVLEDYYPTGSDVCRNVLISARFNQLMDERTVSTNFIVAKNVASVTTCASGTTPLDAIPPLASGWRATLARTWSRVVGFFTGEPAIADVWCVGTVHGTVTFEPENGKTRASFLLDEALEPNTQYQVVLRGEPSLSTLTPSSTRRGIRSFRGVLADGDLRWNFTTGNRVCTVDQVNVYDTSSQHPLVFYRSTEAHRYIARPVSIHNGTQVPITPIARLYSWFWMPWISSNENVIRTVTASSTPALAVATSTAQNQNGTSNIGANLEINADTVNATTTVGHTYGNSVLSTVILCENPWIPRVGGPPSFTDDVYHFSTTYCKDAGRTGTGDDLPDLMVNVVPTSTTDAARGILRQYLFSFDRVSLRGDGLGIRVLANPLHLSPAEWYRSQGFAGTPQALSVDGYEAVKDGDSVYVGAVNTDDSLSRASTNIYLVSRNPDAGPEATAIFDQFVSNLRFNTNITQNVEGVCKRQGGAIYLQNGGVVRCAADWECIRYENTLSCASTKTKIQRDLKRINDFQYIGSRLEETKARTSRYPTVSSGTFLQTFVSSRWPSWSSTLGAAVGNTALPQDPLNVNLSCGVCLAARTICMEDADCPGSADRCLPQSGFDPMTCWNAASSTFMCPMASSANPSSVSHQYQYQSLAAGTRYQLATELEQLPPSVYQPPLLTEIRRCVSTSTSNGHLCDTDRDCDVYGVDRTRPIGSGRCSGEGGRWVYGNICHNQVLGQGGVCGDGILNTAAGEVCELGQTQTIDCPADGGRPGRKTQVCADDCRSYVDGSTTVCSARLICGNGRMDTGETCDDGPLNGAYGHCNRTCNGYAAMCGDGQLSVGELCDRTGTSGVSLNGQYCDNAPGGTCPDLTTSCSADCRDVAPHCGDGLVQTESGEQCDGAQTESSTSAICWGGSNNGRTCTVPGDCPGGQCGGDAAHNSCVGVGGGLCAGGLDPAHGGHDGQSCSCPGGVGPGGHCDNATQCGRNGTGQAIQCVIYPTRHTHSCTMPTSVPVVNQCRWANWTACVPEHFCGDGVLDSGEQCDDGNRNDNDACTNQCKTNVCGDNVMQIGVEECDYGNQNGQACTGADYGSTCSACTSQCRMTASSGGYCGDNHRNGSEQCDGGDLSRATSTLTCVSLGYDYARTRTTVYGSDLSPHEVDNISCGRTCGYEGCARCADETGTGVITATVYDAVYSITPVQGARVTLYQNGIRVGEQTTDATGVFTFRGLNSRAECSGYRIVVDLNRDNPLTTTNESINGGYWSYESNIFGVSNFRSVGIENTNGKIFLVPRVGLNETLVVTDWNGTLPAGSAPDIYRYVDAHLILPSGSVYPVGGRSMNRDVYYRAVGNPDMSVSPHANLFCFHSNSSTNTDCGSFSDAPEVTLYKRGTWASSGQYSYILNDYYHWGPTQSFYNTLRFHVRIVTRDRLYTVRVPTAPAPSCDSNNWLVFQQDAATGNVSIPGEGGTMVCADAVLPGEAAGVTPATMVGPDTP